MHLRESKAVPAAVIIIALSYGAFAGYQGYADARQAAAAAHREEARIDANRAQLLSALGGISGLSELQIQRGFWYDYTDQNGNDSVLYFDLYSAARQGLDAGQIALLVSHVSSSSIIDGKNVTSVAEQALPAPLQFHNAIYQSATGGESSLSMESALADKVRSGAATSDELFQLSYLEELAGNYAARDELNTENCARFQARCADTLRVTLRGSVHDSKDNAIEGARVEVLSRPDAPAAQTDENGAYALSLSVKEMEKLRIHAYKRNYSDGYADAVILGGAGGTVGYSVDDIRLESPITITTIDFAKRTVTGIGNEYHPDGSVTLHTAQSTYEIPAGAIVHEDGSPYTGNTADVYLYEFTKGDPPPNLTNLDTFDQVRGYAGNLMKSFGMPFIQFFAPSGEELHVLSSRAMTLTYSIPDMDALRANTDGIYRALTDADMNVLVRASAGGGYPIDREFLIEHQLLQFPAFWVFDHKRGVWDNIGIAVLNTQGTIRTPFYTIRDGI